MPPPMPDRPTARAAPTYFRPSAMPPAAAAASAPAAEALPPMPTTLASTRKAKKEAMLAPRARLAFWPVYLRMPMRNRGENTAKAAKNRTMNFSMMTTSSAHPLMRAA